VALAAEVVAHGSRSSVALDRDALEQLTARPFFWLDLFEPTEAELTLLADLLDLHPLAVEDAVHFGQRTKVEEYEGFVFVVLFGWAPDEDWLAEVHAFFSERYLVTVHRDDCPALTDVAARVIRDGAEGIGVLYRVADALVDGFFPVLTRSDERLEVIEEEIFAGDDDAPLREIMRMKRRLAGLRRAIAPQRDVFARISSGSIELPGMTPEAERYFRDVYDHLIRLVETLDTHRDLMTATIDVYLSSVSNRQNVVMKQLTLIASIFLPLTFVTGYFGQNFGWLVDHVSSVGAFLLLGVGVQLAAAAVLLAYFKRQGWY
jgi:magnesium transporter